MKQTMHDAGAAVITAPEEHHVTSRAEKERQVMRKVSLRILPFVMIMFISSYLDRINIGFAALAMNKDLNLTAAMYGLANSIFYVGYVLCEVPSNMIMEKVGARIWIARIMVTWGILSAATMFATGPQSLYVIRFLVGVAEAGFVPGVLLFLTFYFPPSYRARANTLFLSGMPITSAIGSVVSSFILSMGGMYGLSGWQWLFLLEGIPSVLLGIGVFFYFRDDPKLCTWLTNGEKKLLSDIFAREDVGSKSIPAACGGFRSVLKELCSPLVLRFAFCYFCLVVSLNSLSTWTPLIIQSMYQEHDIRLVGLLAAIPAVLAVAAMLWWGFHSDRTQERKWHIALPMLFGGIGWIVAASGAIPTIRVIGIVCASVGAFSTFGVFWTVPVTVLSKEAKAAGIAFIASIGLIGSIVSPTVVGLLRDFTHDYSVALRYAGTMLILGALVSVLGKDCTVATKTKAH